MKTIISLESLEQQIRTYLDEDAFDLLRELLAAQHPADIADVIDRLPLEEQREVFQVLSAEQAAEVLSETSVGATRQLIRHLSSDDAKTVFSYIALDDAVEILGEDVPQEQHIVLDALDPDDAQELRTMLQYPRQSAGRLMSELFVRARPEMTAQEALDYVRQVASMVETITDIYLINREGRLVGVIPLTHLLTAPPNQQLSAIASTDIISVSPDTDQEKVAWLVSQYDLFSIPVVDENQRMLGIITVDDVVDVLVHESTEDVLRFGGVQEGATDETYFSVPIWRAVRRRIVWLLFLFLAGSLTVNVLGHFEYVLSQAVALSFFIPLLIGTGGNTGAQTVSTMVRSLALGEVRMSDAWQVVGREMLGGLLLGSLLSIISFVMALLLSGSSEIPIVVALSTIAICTWANVVGAVVPLVAQRLGLDPALVSAPMITTLVDATGLAIYMGIALLVLDI